MAGRSYLKVSSKLQGFHFLHLQQGFTFRFGALCQVRILNAVFLIAEHKRAAVSDAGQAPLQQENSPAPAPSSRGSFLADIPLVPALVMFIETLKVRIKQWLLKL
ncbi:hypothetical protein C1J03_10090 [Sulfitobacter sp. SK012]|nr:hypothetical protein C1J03_10090 [Sulfitobacter sp. SK012]